MPHACNGRGVFGVRPMQIEKRAMAGVIANGRRLSGYIAKFNSPTTIGSFTEVIRPGAFRASLQSGVDRSEEHTSELQSLMRISYAVFCLKKKKNTHTQKQTTYKHTTGHKEH